MTGMNGIDFGHFVKKRIYFKYSFMSSIYLDIAYSDWISIFSRIWLYQTFIVAYNWSNCLWPIAFLTKFSIHWINRSLYIYLYIYLFCEVKIEENLTKVKLLNNLRILLVQNSTMSNVNNILLWCAARNIWSRSMHDTVIN